MKTIMIYTLISSLMIFSVKAQNPYKYESKVVYIHSVKNTSGPGRIPTWVSNFGALQTEIKKYNDQGYKLAQMTNVMLGDQKHEGVILVFEKSTSYREAELYKLINELTTRIDSTTKNYTLAAMTVIETNVLNYLKSIPNEVITQAYKDALTKIIVYEAEEKLKKIAELMVNEIRKTSTLNN
jgi:hypothetical protein